LETFTWHRQDWCRPPITWHHVGPEEIEEIHEFSEQWARENRKGVPYFYSDIYEALVADRIGEEKELWNNRANKEQGPEGPSTKEACIEACREEKSCIQWMFADVDIERGSKCMFGEQLTIGRSLEEEEDDEGEDKVSDWTSGWIQEKVDKMLAGFGPC
jgi:hypothetical protein